MFNRIEGHPEVIPRDMAEIAIALKAHSVHSVMSIPMEPVKPDDFPEYHIVFAWKRPDGYTTGHMDKYKAVTISCEHWEDGYERVSAYYPVPNPSTINEYTRIPIHKVSDVNVNIEEGYVIFSNGEGRQLELHRDGRVIWQESAAR